MSDLRKLLIEARESLQGGIEDGGDLETEYSKHDRELISRIDAALAEPKDSQPVPVEPVVMHWLREAQALDCGYQLSSIDLDVLLNYIDALQSELREKMESDAPDGRKVTNAQHVALREKHERLVARLREPSKLLVKKVSLAIACEPFSGTTHQELREYDTRIAKEVIKAMSAELLKEVE